MRKLSLMVVLGVGACAPTPPPHAEGVVDEGGYEALPDEVREHFLPEDIDNIVASGVDIHPGANPPDISGTWDLNSMVYWFYEDVPDSGRDTPTMGSGYGATWTLTIPAQAGAPTKVYLDRDPTRLFQEHAEVYVTGKADAFTAFLLISDRNGTISGSDHYKRLSAWVVSGTSSAEGLLDVRATIYHSDYDNGVLTHHESIGFIESDERVERSELPGD